MSSSVQGAFIWNTNLKKTCKMPSMETIDTEAMDANEPIAPMILSALFHKDFSSLAVNITISDGTLRLLRRGVPMVFKLRNY